MEVGGHDQPVKAAHPRPVKLGHTDWILTQDVVAGDCAGSPLVK